MKSPNLTMKTKASQPTDFMQPKIVKGFELPKAIAEAARLGFWSTRLKVISPGVYELRFARMPENATGLDLPQ